ncbi:MAG TPA: cohesin domain-containing protein, partial [Bacteroidales bacterium]|nr:cohesin domain-containing protein [Bacteroidales bacterium]
MLYHFNFGWSGQDNGFFSLNNLNGFNSNQAMVRNFIPKENYPYGCGNDTLTNVNGSFEDGSGPLANYTAGNNCSWLIAPTDSVTSITLNFTAFDVASDDNVNVYDGATTSDPLLGTFTGSTIPTAVTSTGSKMLVTFTTNASNAAKGWQAEYTSTVKTYCSGIANITQPSGTLSDGSGVKNYNNNSLCRWKIQPTGAPFVTLTFSNFQLVDPKDYMEIYDLANNQLLATYTGTTIPPAVTSPSGKMYIVFRTGNFYNGDGWDATFSSTNSLHNISGVINYPKSTPVPLSNIDLTLKDNNGTVVASTTTGADGSYNFASISDGDYTLTPSTTKAWGGVSATDVLLYKKHIAGISTLTGIFLNSGDVNGSGSLSASDILLIKKRIAGMVSSFSVGDWLFDNTPVTVSGNDVIQNFNGLVYGDANASYTPAVKGNYISDESSASFTIQPVTGQSGKIIVPVYASDVQNMGALQFTINYDPSKLQFTGADNWFNGIQDVTVGNPAPGQLTFVWAADANGINITNAKLFDLHFNSLSSETSTINWSDEPTIREYADWNGNISTPKYADGTIGNTLDNSSLTIYPNPNDGSFLL